MFTFLVALFTRRFRYEPDSLGRIKWYREREILFASFPAGLAFLTLFTLLDRIPPGSAIAVSTFGAILVFALNIMLADWSERRAESLVPPHFRPKLKSGQAPTTRSL